MISLNRGVKTGLASLVSAAAILGGLAGCKDSTANNPNVPAASQPTSASKTFKPLKDLNKNQPLLAPGKARAAVEQIIAATDNYPVIMVQLTGTEASVTVLVDSTAVTYEWQAGKVSRDNSTVEYHGQSSFLPKDFNIENLGELFSTAEQISGSANNQTLQIVEYNQNQVAMTVTTNPESIPVFFRKDGSAIESVSLDRVEDVRHAIGDTTSTNEPVLALGYSENEGFWAETPSETKGVVNRRSRIKNTPAFTAPRKGKHDGKTFQPNLVSAKVVARLYREAVDSDPDNKSSVSLHIVAEQDSKHPVLIVQTHSGQERYWLDGTKA